MPGGYVCSATLKAKADAPSIRDVALGKRRSKKLFSKEQRAFFAAHAPDGLTLDDLSILGPIFVLKLNFEPKELGRRMVAELWFYPDGSRILELSTKCTAADAFQVAAEARALPRGEGREPGREAGDEDEGGAHVLLEAAPRAQPASQRRVPSHAWSELLSEWFAANGRDLPWRHTRDPYAILVSEVMLQQTQVDRVVPRYLAWLERWPTVESLAAASAADVIREWQGLGYNRRAVNLHRAAQVVAREGWPDDLTTFPASARTRPPRCAASRSARTCFPWT